MDLGKMTDEQLIELLREGKTEITDYLMEKYKDMVRKQARAMYLWGGENDDLIQEGMIGLFKAVQDYDPKEGASFSSFAGLCVSRQMYTAIKASQRKKHLPLNSYVSIYASASDNPEPGIKSCLTLLLVFLIVSTRAVPTFGTFFSAFVTPIFIPV